VIGSSTASFCYSLAFVSFDGVSQLKRIADRAFFAIPLTRFVIPTSVEAIKYAVFACCRSLESVTFETESRLHLVGHDAFRFCPCCDSIEFPPSLLMKTAEAEHLGDFSTIIGRHKYSKSYL
jgi:hypothetical protein